MVCTTPAGTAVLVGSFVFGPGIMIFSPTWMIMVVGSMVEFRANNVAKSTLNFCAIEKRLSFSCTMYIKGPAAVAVKVGVRVAVGGGNVGVKVEVAVFVVVAVGTRVRVDVGVSEGKREIAGFCGLDSQKMIKAAPAIRRTAATPKIMGAR